MFTKIIITTEKPENTIEAPMIYRVGETTSAVAQFVTEEQHEAMAIPRKTTALDLNKIAEAQAQANSIFNDLAGE